MQQLIRLITVVMLFSSCTTYQYLAVNSTQLPITENKFYAKKDSIEVMYQFNGYNAALTLQIKNNGAQPVIIDWKKSSIITNDISISLFTAVQTFNGTASYDTASNKTSAVKTLDMTGSVTIANETDFIPPNAILQKQTKESIKQPFDLALNENEKIKKTTVFNDVLTLNGKMFSAANTPCKIRVFITYTSADAPSRYIENEFFISEYILSTRSPSTLETLIGNSQPVIYTY